MPFILSVCLSARVLALQAIYEAANEWYQRVVNNEKMDNNVSIFRKRLRSRDNGVKTSEKAYARFKGSKLIPFAGEHAHLLDATWLTLGEQAVFEFQC